MKRQTGLQTLTRGLRPQSARTVLATQADAPPPPARATVTRLAAWSDAGDLAALNTKVSTLWAKVNELVDAFNSLAG